ncbi:ribonuclease J [Salsuginibacillus halophilus]|uniref:Ribonuclease J n=1 Tax=Salsuginibacillus halophilus TaxID=517424 RepID=A0A2P8HYE6_9BACI|nr:ribonuclease J [Salsuginibacillus halophilus]PSL51246.1 ribonuclease J [Salsuginibacillus halophilus]
MANQIAEKIRVFSLGGVGEVGKNMYAVEIENDILVVEAGLMFPEDDMLGVDVVIPDTSYLEQNKSRVRGIIVTHGHEDHIGALPYVLKKVNVPVYGTKLTLGLVEDHLKTTGMHKKADLRLVTAGSTETIGDVPVSFFHTNHSIPDCVGVSIETDQGLIVYTGDFKFDQTPVDGKITDFGTLHSLGEKGVLCLLSDCTNADRPGTTPSELEPAKGINRVFQEANSRVVITTFASNLFRIQQIIDASVKTKRKITVVGASIYKTIQIARRLGYLRAPKNIFVKPEEIGNFPDEQVTVLCTGSQGEPMSAISRLAKGADQKLSIQSNDTVIISATPSPGTEKSVSQIVDFLYKIGCEVITPGQEKVHVSGHASQEELRLMLNLLQPKYVVPVHGEYRKQFALQQVAAEQKVKPENTFLIDKGEVVEFAKGQGRVSGKVPSGNVLIDGLGVGDVGNIVLRDRRLLSEDGILVIVVTLSKKTGAIVSGPDIVSRGFVYVRESEKLMEEANKKVNDTLEKCMSENVNEWSSLKSNVRDVLSKFLYEKTKRRPMILPIIMEV